MRSILIAIILIGAPSFIHAQIAGEVLDKTHKTPIVGVWLNFEEKQTVSDTEGRFSLETKGLNDSLKIYCSHSAYHDTLFSVSTSNKNITIFLTPKTDTLEEVTINEKNHTEKHRSSGQTFTRDELETLSNPLGEPDLLSSIQTGTGVLQTGEMNSGLFVRGGSSAQSVILLQNIPVFNPAHLLGLVNNIDPDALSKASFYKSNIPPQIGGWLSGYVIGEGRSTTSLPSKEVKIGIGTLASDVLVLAPVPKAHTDVVVKARSSYMQLITTAYNHLHESKPGFSPLPNYSFTDWTVQSNTRFGKGQLSLLYFQSLDYYKGTAISPRLKSNWGNQLFSIKWKQTLGTKGWLSSVLGSSKYKFIMDHENQLWHNLSQAFQGYFFQLNYGRDLGKNRIFETGIFANKFIAESNNIQSLINGEILLNSKLDQDSHVIGGFIDLEEENDPWGWKAGFRMSSNNEKLYFEPRASLYYRFLKWKLLLFYDHTYQFHHKVNVLGINMPFDFFVLSGENIPVQFAQHLGTSLTRNLALGLNITWNLYYKWLEGQPNYHKGLELFFQSAEKMIEPGRGIAYGTELDLTFKKNKWMIYTGYSIGETKRENIGNGIKTWIYPPYDVRHQLNINTSYQLNSSINFAVAWFYQSGAPTTYPIGILPMQGLEPLGAGSFVPAYDAEGNVRMPSTHRLDLSMTYIRKKKKGESIWNLGVYNCYNQANPYFIYYDILSQENGTGKIVTKQRALLPIVPTFKYSRKF